jgi:hypothetical protein
MPTETLFEWLERTRWIDTLLLVLALVGPLVVSGLAWWCRGRPVVEHRRADWFLAVISCPLVFLLWRGYNGIMDRFGLETIWAFVLCVLLFGAVSAGVAGLLRVLDARWGRRPAGAHPVDRDSTP